MVQKLRIYRVVDNNNVVSTVVIPKQIQERRHDGAITGEEAPGSFLEWASSGDWSLGAN
jgi:hypothetical protein